jgi:hypothetical protein
LPTWLKQQLRNNETYIYNFVRWDKLFNVGNYTISAYAKIAADLTFVV